MIKKRLTTKLIQKSWPGTTTPPTYLCSQIWDANELLEDVLGQDVCVARLLDVIRWHVDVVGSEVEISSRYGSAEWEWHIVSSYVNILLWHPFKITFNCVWSSQKVSIPDSPFSLRRESLGLVVGGGGSDDLVTVLVHSSGLRGCELRLLFSLLLNLSDLLTLLRWSWDLHSQDDVTDLRLGQRSHVHTG